MTIVIPPKFTLALGVGRSPEAMQRGVSAGPKDLELGSFVLLSMQSLGDPYSRRFGFSFGIVSFILATEIISKAPLYLVTFNTDITVFRRRIQF